MMDFRKVKQLDDQHLKAYLRKYTSTQLLHLPYSQKITRDGWVAIANTPSISEVHIDFSGHKEIDKTTLQALKEVVQAVANQKRELAIYIQHAGGLDFESLSGIQSSVAGQIVSLDLEGSKILGSELVHIIQGCDQLEELYLDKCKKLKDAPCLKQVANECPRLRKLSLGLASKFSEGDLINLLKRATNLEYLNVGWHHYLTDVTLNTLSENCHNLQDLNFCNLISITDEAMLKLVQSCSRIRDLNLNYCNALTPHTLTALKEHSYDLRYVSLKCFSTGNHALFMTSAKSLIEERSNQLMMDIDQTMDPTKELLEFAEEYPNVKVNIAKQPNRK